MVRDANVNRGPAAVAHAERFGAGTAAIRVAVRAWAALGEIRDAAEAQGGKVLAATVVAAFVEQAAAAEWASAAAAASSILEIGAPEIGVLGSEAPETPAVPALAAPDAWWVAVPGASAAAQALFRAGRGQAAPAAGATALPPWDDHARQERWGGRVVYRSALLPDATAVQWGALRECSDLQAPDAHPVGPAGLDSSLGVWAGLRRGRRDSRRPGAAPRDV